MDYNRVLLLGHCEAGANFVRDSLIASEKIEFEEHNSALVSEYPKVNMDILNFMTRKNPEGKVLCTHSTHPKLLNKLNIFDFSSWKFIYIDRDIYGSYPSGYTDQVRKFQRDFTPTLTHAASVIGHLNRFYHKIKHNCFRIHFDDLFKDPVDRINDIFTFLKIRPPEPRKIIELSEVDHSITFMKETKLVTGHEFQEFFTTDFRGKFNEVLKDHPDRDAILLNASSAELVKDTMS